MKKPTYVGFKHKEYKWKPDIDYRKNPHLYEIGRGQQGVLICQPYKSELHPLWRFKTPEEAQLSAIQIINKFFGYLEEGDFVINAPAVEMAGRSDVERMVTKAITELQRKGVKLDFGTTADDIDSMVDALVSNGEMIIPKVLAEQIGYDRLEKINNRGKERQ